MRGVEVFVPRIKRIAKGRDEIIGRKDWIRGGMITYGTGLWRCMQCTAHGKERTPVY